MQGLRMSNRLLRLSRYFRQLPCSSRQLCNERNESAQSRLSDVSTAGIGMRRIGRHIVQSVRRRAPPSEVQMHHLNIDALAAALATQCADGYDFEAFANNYGLHDNFNVYFRVNVLRLWYCLLRATELLDAEQFERLKTSAINVMWRDVTIKIEALKDELKGVRVSRHVSLTDMHGTMVLMFLELDEACLSDDRELAACVWRHFYGARLNADLVHISQLTRHIRKSIYDIHALNADVFLAEGVPAWRKYLLKAR